MPFSLVHRSSACSGCRGKLFYFLECVTGDSDGEGETLSAQVLTRGAGVTMHMRKSSFCIGDRMIAYPIFDGRWHG